MIISLVYVMKKNLKNPLNVAFDKLMNIIKKEFVLHVLHPMEIYYEMYRNMILMSKFIVE